MNLHPSPHWPPLWSPLSKPSLWHQIQSPFSAGLPFNRTVRSRSQFIHRFDLQLGFLSFFFPTLFLGILCGLQSKFQWFDFDQGLIDHSWSFFVSALPSSILWSSPSTFANFQEHRIGISSFHLPKPRKAFRGFRFLRVKQTGREVFWGFWLHQWFL